MQRTAATPELALLNAFEGIWDTEGEVLAGPLGQPVRFKATDTYEWLPGGYFMLHRFDAHMPDGQVIGIEVIGYNRESLTYPFHSFDSNGNATLMQGRMEDERWIIEGESMRFIASFTDKEMVLAGSWEMRAGEGYAWQPWMKVRLKKV